MSVYTDRSLLDVADAVEALPSFASSAQTAAKATMLKPSNVG